MATTQKDGVSAVTSTSTVNNGGVAKNVGTSTVLDNVVLGDNNVSVFGSTVLDNSYTDPALNAGVFKYDNARPIAKRVTSSLATVSKTALQSGASVPANFRSIHKRESFKVKRVATAIRAGYWNIYTGTWTSTPVSSTETPGSNGGIDNAANPTRTKPGELVYKTGARLPVRDDYKAKTA